MRRRLIIIFVVVVLLAVVLFVFGTRRVPVLRVQVVDQRGAPVAGATILPHGIRGTDSAHYGWGDHFSVRPRPVKTDSNGQAKIRYPRYIRERVRSIKLSFDVDHPDFLLDRPFVDVAAPIRSTTPIVQRLKFIYQDYLQNGKTERIVLKRGAAIEIFASIAGKGLLATNFHAQFPFDEAFDGGFNREGDRLISKRVPEGEYILRVFSKAGGTNYFSEVLTLVGVPSKTNVVRVELMPGHDVEGRIEGVHRPMKNGWVNARVINSGSRHMIVWADFAEVSSDGSFIISGLPAGTLECVALCDGYLSMNPGTKAGSFVYPQRFDIPLKSKLVIPMRASAAASVRVIGPDSKPVEGASVNFWPNIQWAGYWSTRFASDFYREAEALAGKISQPWSLYQSKRDFTAKTDKEGRAVVLELPPEPLSFSVSHSDHELPMNAQGERSITIRLTTGETNFAGAQLERKGGQQLE